MSQIPRYLLKSCVIFISSLLPSLPTLSLGLDGLPSQSEGEVSFTLDAARFRLGEGRTYLELYYEVPFEELTYVESGDGMKASFRAIIEARDAGGEGGVDTVDRVSYVSSLEEARSRDLSALDQYEVYPLKPGGYDLTLRITDLNSGRVGEVRKEISIEDWPDRLTLSDIQLAIAVEQDTVGGSFVKRGLRVTPNPARQFGNSRSLLYSYGEIYNLEGEQYEVKYSVLDRKGSLVKTLPSRKFSTPGPIALEVGAINVIALPAGEYSLKVEVNDGVGSTFSEASFTVAEPVLPREKLIATEQAREVYTLINYVATQEELRFYNSLSDSGKEQYLVAFWKRRDPNPATPENEALEEFARRIMTADSEYGSQLQEGRQTDRGRVYIKYGVPDEVERRPAELAYEPYESWLYYGGGGKQFVFVDHSGYGNYELVYSSVETELLDPNWYKYVDPSVIQVQRR